MKKSKVTKVTKFDKVDSYGNTSFSIELENGDKGFFSTKSQEQTKFVVGKEAEYNIEEKEAKKGGTYFKITLPQIDGQWPKSGRPAPEPRIQMISFAMAYTKDLVVAGKVRFDELPATFDILYNEMIGKI